MSSKISPGEWAILLLGGADRASFERALDRADAERTIPKLRVAEIRRALVEDSAVAVTFCGAASVVVPPVVPATIAIG